MIYVYDKSKLVFKNVFKRFAIYLTLFTTGITVSAFTISYITTEVQPKSISRTHISEDTLVLQSFNEKEFVLFLKEINIKYPHIVYAQALVESSHFSSDIFKHNHNLFGMKMPRVRCTLAKGTKRNHAYFDHWTESVIDYALYQSAYMRNIKSEEDYFAHLSRTYAEDPKYVSKLKSIISNNNLDHYIDSI